MEIRVLEYFLAVVQEGNITKAAESLSITQPTLSRQLRALENELDVKLFIRGGNKKIALTDEGLLLKRRAEEIIELNNKTYHEVKKGYDDLEGTIAIGAAESFSAEIIADVINYFRINYPEVKFDIFSNNASSVSEKLDKGLLDFGILIEPTNLLKYNWVRLKAVEKWGVLMLKDSPLTSIDYVSYDDIVNLPLLCSKQLVDGEFDTWFKESTHKLNIIATYNLINNGAMLVKKGVGYAITIEGAGEIENHRELVFKPFFPLKTSTSVLVWKKQPLNCKCADKFIEVVKMLLEHN